jgi:hypothetical protein
MNSVGKTINNYPLLPRAYHHRNKEGGSKEKFQWYIHKYNHITSGSKHPTSNTRLPSRRNLPLLISEFRVFNKSNDPSHSFNPPGAHGHVELREPNEKKNVAKANCVQSLPSYFPGTKSEFLTPKTSDVLTLP